LGILAVLFGLMKVVQIVYELKCNRVQPQVI
jgi:hypothetical protein